MKKILILMPSLVGGGAERTLINFLNKVDYQFYCIDLVVVSNKGIYLDQVPEEVKLISLFNSDLFVRIAAYLQKKNDFTFFFKWRVEQKISDSYDVAVSFLDGNFTELLFFIKNAKKRITWVHGSYRSNDNFYRFFKNKKYRHRVKIQRYDKLDYLIFVSQDTRKEFESLFGVYNNSKVIYNIIDAQMVKKKAQAFKVENNKLGILYFFAMGSLLKVKGFDRLIYAAQIMKKRGLNFLIQIAGDGPERSSLDHLIESLGLREEVKLLGFQKNPYPLLKACDLFVLSSYSEALPTVICEAMILGKPIVATDCAGARELIGQDEFGFLAEQSIKSLADKIFNLATDKNLMKFYSEKAIYRAAIFEDKKIMTEYYNILSK